VAPIFLFSRKEKNYLTLLVAVVVVNVDVVVDVDVEHLKLHRSVVKTKKHF